MTPEWLIIADDLTGACDTGAAFAHKGWKVRVAFSPSLDFGGAQVWVISTESRAFTESRAVQVVKNLVSSLQSTQPRHIYKKIDSTLRGHPGAEISAVMDGFHLDRALMTPAFPEQGRTVIEGRVWVNGIPLEETSMGREIRQADLTHFFEGKPAACALTLEQVREGLECLCGRIRPPGIFIADAETTADLNTLAKAGELAGVTLYSGSAGLARALVDEQREERYTVDPPVQAPGTVLVVAGSRNPATFRQIEFARGHGAKVASPFGAEEIFRSVSTGNGDKNIILTAEHLPSTPGAEAQVAAKLADHAAQIIDRLLVKGLVLTGGDIAVAVCRRLNCSAIDLGGEVQPGIVWGRLVGGMYPGLPVITKAGGFGQPDSLVRSIQFLTGE